MRRAERQLDEEGTVAVGLDEAFGLSVEFFLQSLEGQAVLARRFTGIRGKDRERRHVVTIGYADEAVEAVSCRQPVGRAMAKVPLAEQASGVCRLERRRDRDLTVQQGPVIALHDHFKAEARAQRIPARQDSGARRGADVRGAVIVGGKETLARHLRQRRRLEDAAIGGNVAVTQIIRQHEDDVGRPATGFRRVRLARHVSCLAPSRLCAQRFSAPAPRRSTSRCRWRRRAQRSCRSAAPVPGRATLHRAP